MVMEYARSLFVEELIVENIDRFLAEHRDTTRRPTCADSLAKAAGFGDRWSARDQPRSAAKTFAADKSDSTE